MTEKLISQSLYARQRGVSRQYISKLVKEGVIPTINGKIDPDEADKILGNLSKRLDYSEAKTLVMNIKAQLLQIERDMKMQKLVDIDKVINHMTKIGNIVRDSLLLIPAKVSHQVAAEKNPNKCMEIIDKEIRQALQELSKLGQKP